MTPAGLPREPRSVAVLAGGLSHERDVSLRSGRRVVDALRDVGLEAVLHDVDAALLPALAAEQPDVVVPLLHGATGEDGAVREVLTLLDLAFVGSDAAACRRSFDKPLASRQVAEAGVAVPGSVVLPESMFRELGAKALLDRVVTRLGLPLVVKPARGGSSLGVTVVRDASALPAAMVACFGYGDVAVLEQHVSGVEVAVSVVDRGDGPVPLPAVEIEPDGGWYGYEARYTPGATRFYAPARLDPLVAARCAEAAVLAHRTLGLRDLSRTDLVVDPEGQPWFLEVNVAPGQTETSLFPQAVAAAGGGLGEVWAALVDAAVRRGAS